jgi:MinD superfamily P-loop ATPase
MTKKIKKIVVTGGKGGTGKSTFAVLLANEYARRGKKIVLCDCDVECPNDYLLVNKKLKKPRQKIYTFFPRLDKRKCKKCGLCSRHCRNNAIFYIPNQYPVFLKDLCSGCGVCWNICPYKAIKPKKEKIGEIYLNKIRKNFWLITGVINSKIQETASAVSQVKKFSISLAEKKEIEIIIFDTAAGTHCPVVKTIIDTDKAELVTEPTPMGAHDLEIMIDLLRKFKLRSEIIINQMNLGNKSLIFKIAQKNQIKIKKEIPYSKEIANAYSKGQLLRINLSKI